MKKQNYFFIFFVVVCIIALIFVYVKTDVYQVTLAIDGVVYKTVEVRKNTEYGSVERPEKEGYTFLGWYDENNNLLEENTKITDDTVYYAKWAVIVTDDEETE
ncbi:TPA: InlB B-repeat-containing protein [Candidatus Ventrenecus avicola]|nr:InlB B-repeat-containing protein [Candidatus Ventrenecus avicola]